MKDSKEYTPEAPIRVRTFGGFELENEHGRITENLQRPSLSWQLLKYLFVNRGSAVDMEDIMEMLWPDEEELSDAILRVRLRRLRDALEPLRLADRRRGLVLYSYGKFSLNSDYELETDEEEYRAVMEKLRAADVNEPEGLELCLRALELQRGDYMGERNEIAWLRPYRDYYRREFMYLAQSTLERTKALGDNRAVELLCGRAVVMAPEAEELHRAVIGHLVEQKLELELLRYVSRLSRKGARWLEEYEY